MTKYERQMKSMLSYYEIDFGGTRDEKMNKKDLQKFINTLNSNYDAQVVQDILSKIRDKFKNKPQDEESDDPFFSSLDSARNEGDEGDETENRFPLDLNALSKGKGLSNKGNGKNPFGLNPEIEMFINWLSDLLYSADHKVVIRESEDGQTTNIELQKIKKRGGRKK